MKYHPLFEGRGFSAEAGETWLDNEGQRRTFAPLDRFEDAQVWIKARAEMMGLDLKGYSVHCGELGDDRRPVKEPETLAAAMGLSGTITNYPADNETDLKLAKEIPGVKSVSGSVQPANPKQLYGDKKLPVHLVPPALVLEASLNMGDGAEKYGAYNYRDSKVEAMTYVGAMQRHLFSYLDGEDVDPESKRGATHLGAIAACVAILVDARNSGKLIDNRPAKGTAGERIRAAAGVVLPSNKAGE